MEQTAAALVPGLALGGVLAAAAAWSRSCRAGVVPHLGLGATAAVAVSAAVRFGHLPWPVELVVAGAAGGGFGAAAEALDRRIGATPPPWAGPPLTADVAVIGLAIATAGLLTPGAAATLSDGALGGAPDARPALAAVAAGVGVALLLAARQPPGLSRKARWALTGAGLGAGAALAAGLVGGGPQGAAGVALRAAAGALAGRRDPVDAAGAGLALGLVEALLRGVYPLGHVTVLPAAGAALLGLLVGLRRRDLRVATGGG